MRRLVRPLPFLALLAALAPLPALAAWPHDPSTGSLPVTTAANDQVWPSSLSDGAGGAFIAWHGGLGNDIYVQHVSATGTPLWTANGVPICIAGAGQGFPFLASDGAGGVIAAWYDYRFGNADI